MAIPQTLFGRTFLFIALLIFLSGGSWFALFSLAEREPRALRLADLAASAVNLTRAALVAADPTKRLALLQDLADSEGIRLYPLEESDAVVPLPESYFFATMRRAVAAQLDPRTRFAGEVNGQPGVWVSFSIDDDDHDYWLMLPGERAREFISWQWLGWGAASLALALCVAWLTVFHVTRPLRALATAARSLGQAGVAEPVREAGVAELRQVAEAFNRMSDDLKRNAAERALVLAGLSHDLRTPLARLRLECELSIADGAARDAAVADIEQMDAIITQFLAYARGEDDEAPADADLDALIENLARRPGRFSTPPRLRLATPRAARVRPKALSRALANLLDNAGKYGAEPISIASRREGAEIVIDVEDSGPGIPEDELERIKRPFTRLENARTDTTGTGLGLAIVERIARLHEGRFELINRPGGGMIARLRLPIRA
ncbi:MAG: HAMP domain-containing protein [Candidatus Accumulibacter sp.]|jgi:two-component system osmolarity sensor histidine kinase EnvZ|nr:HAMP domain-containing protein [Accumulibacter sp.]